LPAFEVGRAQIAQEAMDSARIPLEKLGIKLLDLRFKRINYSPSVREETFDRLISERKAIAMKFRTEGEGEAAKILGTRDKELKQIQSEAYKEQQKIIGAADAEAIQIYAEAYNQSEESRKFYQFYKTMESYGTNLTEKSRIILSSESEFYKYLISPQPEE
jgi:modulator of FtsH protease HflC